MAQQGCCGVFLTAGDFSAGKALLVETGKTGSQVSAGDLLNGKHLFVSQSGSIRRIDTRNVYAVQCCDGRIVRIYREGYYTLVNPGERILLYKVTRNPVCKGDIFRIKYFFSKDAGSDIEELTRDNLKAAFPDNHAFDDAVDNQFRADDELYAYDNFHKCYKLNRVYSVNN